MPLNLEQHRGAVNVWDRPSARGWHGERWCAAVTGAALIWTGLRRRSVSGIVLAIGGGALAWWASQNADVRHEVRGELRALWPFRRHEDVVLEASEESFPASDAPSWTSGDGAPHGRGSRWH